MVNNEKKQALRYKMQMKLSSARLSATIRLETKQVCLQHSLLLKLNKEIELICKSLGREFHAAGAE